MVSREEIFSHLHPDSLADLPRIRAETVFNPLGKTAGVVMYWVPEIKDSNLDTPEGIHQSMQWLTQGQPIPVDKRALAAQLSQLVVFDFLTSNPDRYSGGNMKTSADGSRLLFMDNTMSFFIEPEGNEHTRSTSAPDAAVFAPALSGPRPSHRACAGANPGPGEPRTTTRS
jgi:hypothetical protein